MSVHRRALEAPAFAALAQSLGGSALVSGSTLTGPFQASRGFSAIFTAPGKSSLLRRFPALEPFFAKVLTVDANAWYLNVLVVADEAGVGRHIDATLRKPSGDQAALPTTVSVLYLKAPHRGGGKLHIFTRPFPRVVTPRPNLVVTFRGHLAHRVDGVKGERTSVVLEQYTLGAEALARLPALQVDSKAGFAAFLEAHRKGPPAALERDDG